MSCTEKKISKTKLLKGDILYSRVGASYGVAAIFDREEEYGVYVSLTHIRVNDTLNNIFLKQFLNSPKARIQAEQGVFQGGGVQNLNVGVVEEFNLTLPSKQEQTKIASFLSTVDEKINQLTQKHQLLTQYKQGMMQKLFSQQIRFKADDGSEFREWKIGKLGDITSIQGGFAFKSTNFGKGMTKVIRIGDIEKNINLDSFTGIYSNEIPDTRYLISENAIVMALSGATFGKLGKVNQGYAYINQRVATFKVFEDSLNEFVYQIMLSQEFTTYIQSIPSASAQPNISNQDVINFEMMIPCLEEQTKIANFLSAIDQKIEVTEQQIEQAKQWKKGLLQQMFV
ncbi:restriction endonuclease subunit S [Acinetobacter sp. YT-02]|uniref:restriction endonuclease subunit S n=1 Tax=Acinetobacter sp. YT-02 TaxID=2018564 RepID=UPI000BDB2D2F|nr:restriction endonuclease subunit S [Acinetobacter sp. YT-02]PCN59230.1 hypothetical protein CF596_14355 [Acinetobacter sp. YT-02]